MVFVKICGITQSSTLPICVDNGADAVGFVVGVPDSPRNLTEKQALTLINDISPSIQTVVVTSIYSLNEVEYIAGRFSKSKIQVHFRCRLPRFEELCELNLERIIPALTAQQAIHLNPDLPSFQKILNRIPYILIDGSLGMGRLEDVNLAVRAIKRLHPCKIVLAGGLNSNNLLQVLQIARPFGVDVSSGVEQAPGIKNPERIKTFLTIAKHFEEKSPVFEDYHNKQNLIQFKVNNDG
ncbi:MAG: N-(5'-phosphoribosyl)anthranilate isomerase [Promethearchaeota archaeon CR_4]|nr:MAG: N-(5'-phosphoribosyl)anthranilate isomerase [Candidatus Lokiarchaeota archaeon CR_4]